eukprot:contig_9879_g2361
MAGSQRHPLSADEVATVASLREQGKSLRAIGSLLGSSKSTVTYAAMYIRAAADGTKVDKRGRPKVLTDHELRSLKRLVDDQGERVTCLASERGALCAAPPTPDVQCGRQSVMVWRGFSARGRTPLVRVKVSMNAAKYAGVLENYVVHQVCSDYGAPDAAWLQKDLAPCHAAKAAKEVKEVLGLKVLPWVGQSPDLNPIEN